MERENDLLKTENSALKEQLGFMRRFMSKTPFAAAAGKVAPLLPVTSPHADAAAGGGARRDSGARRTGTAATATGMSMAIVLCVVVAVGTGGVAELAGGVGGNGVAEGLPAAFTPPAADMGGPDAAVGGGGGDDSNGWHASLPMFVAWSVPLALWKAGAGVATKVATAGGVANVGGGATVMWHAACAGAAAHAQGLAAVAAGFGGLLANHVRAKVARLRKLKMNRRRHKLQ